MLMKDDDATYSDDFKMKLGWHFGGVGELELNDNMSVEAALMLSSKGYKYEDEDWDVKNTFSPLFLHIPILFKYGVPVGDFKLFGQAGPYLAYGIGGKTKVTSDNPLIEDSDESIKWGSGDDDDLKPLDFGLNIGAGIAFEMGLEANLFYELGLGNHAIETEGGTKIANRVFGISFAYKFGK
jgi:hypothetical protein